MKGPFLCRLSDPPGDTILFQSNAAARLSPGQARKAALMTYASLLVTPATRRLLAEFD
jgi:hypothetical protein